MYTLGIVVAYLLYLPSPRPLLFTSAIVYVQLCMPFWYTKRGNFVLSAIATVVTVAEILKNNGLAVEKSESCWMSNNSMNYTLFSA